MTEPETESAVTAERGAMVSGLILKALAIVFTLLACLSILSYSPEDAQLLHEGLGEYTAIHNWAGRFGAWLAAWSFFWFGLAVYPALVLLLICVAGRIRGPRVKTLRASYFAGVLIFVWGGAMFLGIFPGVLSRLTSSLNISGMPGGVIGQRFCAPASEFQSSGWMSHVVNPTGSVIISVTMMLLGLSTVCYFDWFERVRNWWGRVRGPRRLSRVGADSRCEPDDLIEPELIVENLERGNSAFQVRDSFFSRTPAPEAGTSQYADYRFPELSLLDEPSEPATSYDPKEISLKKRALQRTLESFGIDATVGETTCGPRVTLFEIKPAPGIKVERISALANNIAMNLKAESLRILTPIPGKDSVGIEVPNEVAATVCLREIMASRAWRESRAALPICLGKDIAGNPVILDLARAPHLLIAGATGSGKSVCINSLIMSLLYRFRPDQLKMILVDPKVVEFRSYKKLPHLVTPVITNTRKVPLALHWAVKQMQWRYQILSQAGVRNIAAYNARPPETEVIVDDEGQPIPAKLPYIVLIIDELADIMLAAKQEVETLLARIAQMARAVGIHTVLATQRPSVNIITGVIKANFPTRIAFQVTSIVDSRTILDGKGAESLLGRGDMLFRPPGGSRLARTQGCLVSDDEIERVVDVVATQAKADFAEDIFAAADGSANDDAAGPAGRGNSGFSAADEELIERAIQVILTDRRATTSHIQRRLRIGYNRAALVIEELERRGIVGPQTGATPREILLPTEEAEQDVASLSAENQ